MSKHIDANALAYMVASDGDADFISKVTRLMIEAPSIDIVRCAECVWRDKDNQGEAYCIYVKGLADINEDSFCSYGERRE